MVHITRRKFMKILKSYRLYVLVAAIFLLNRLIISDNADTPIRSEKLFKRSADNVEETISCNSAFDPRQYISETYARNVLKSGPHGECKPDWVLIDENRIFRYNHNYLNTQGLIIQKCFYSRITYKDDFHYKLDTNIQFEDGTALPDDLEFFTIECKADKKDSNANFIESLLGSKYRNAFAKIPSKKSDKDTERSQQPINVLFLGFDSVSKQAWVDNLPRASKFTFEDLNATLLQNYNIVGDGTPAALIALLTGKYEHELPNTLYGTENPTPVDKAYPFIWGNFSRELNYATLFAEDWPLIGTFQYRMIGMSQQPTTHYMRPFQMVMWDEKFVKQSEKLCLGGQKRVNTMLDYTMEFMKRYSKSGFFGFTFLNEYSHGLDDPLGWADGELLTFLKKFKENNLHENTILIQFADHGPRFSNVRSTIKGLLEERNPFFAIYLPTVFQQRYPDRFRNLRGNFDSLVTPFDVFETLKEVLSLEKTGRAPVFSNFGARSTSLFQEVPKTRTCADADVELHWCSCLKRKRFRIDSFAMSLANKFVDFLNNDILREHWDICSKLSVKSIENVYLLQADKSILKNTNQRAAPQVSLFRRFINFFVAPVLTEVEVHTNYEQYQIQVVTSPNNGLFEFTIEIERNLKVQQDSQNYKINKNLISRINKYGNQSICVNDNFPELRKYCSCK